MAKLLNDITEDVRKLMEQQLVLFREEVKQDLRKLKTGTMLLGAALGGAALAVIFLLLMLVFLFWSVSTLPLWIWFGVVGGALALLALTMGLAAKNQLGSVHAVPPESAQALKETVQCITNPK
jgi:protein-S-isoprenylcysteine O-methyltransferase Ste14